MIVEFSIRKLDYRKWWTELREHFGSQVVKHGWQVTAYSKADSRASREFHKLYKGTNYKIIFEVESDIGL